MRKECLPDPRRPLIAAVGGGADPD